MTCDGRRVAHKAIGPGSLVASRFRLEDLLEDTPARGSGVPPT